jgi:hypothetical protein
MQTSSRPYRVRPQKPWFHSLNSLYPSKIAPSLPRFDKETGSYKLAPLVCNKRGFVREYARLHLELQ